MSRPCDNYISISLLQGLVNTFLNFFRSLCIDRPQETTQLFYHLHLLLSTAFLNFFRFFKLTSLARQLNYSIKYYPSLSSSFSCFFTFLFLTIQYESSIMKLATSLCSKIFVLLSFSKPVISFDNRLETVRLSSQG